MWLIHIEDGNQFRFEQINRSFTEVTGLTNEQVNGLLMEEVLPETSHALVREKYNEAIRTGQIVDYIEVAVHPAGEKVGEIRVIPIKDDEGRVIKIVGIAHDVTEKTALQKKLEKERDELNKKITAAALRGQEAERDKISLELHDNINQVLTTVKLYTELCAAGAVDLDIYLPKCTSLLNDTINEIRRLSKQLASPPLRTLGLEESMRDLVDSISQTRQAEIELRISPFACTTIEEDLLLATYRIAQEQLTNILKHAQAKKITIELECNKSELRMTITDDGIGFDPQKKRSGIGISNMFSRARLLNGDLNIETEEGKGCRLTVIFPVLWNEGSCGC